MRIAFISASKIPSRTANSIEVMKVCQAFQRIGHTVHLWVPGPKPRVAWSEVSELYGLKETISITWVPSWGFLRRYDFSIRAIFRGMRWGADSYYVWPLQAAALASSLNLPTILEVHDAPQGRLGPWLFRRFLHGPGAIRILPITESMRAWLVNTYQTQLEPPFSIIAPSGVDLDRYSSLPAPKEARRRLEWPDQITVGYTGHLYPGRGMELMIDLARLHPEMQFVWAGGEPDRVDAWREKIGDEGLDNLTLLGFVSNEHLPLVQSACDFLLLPHERKVSGSSGGDIARFTSPMKLFEYLASGRVILASNLPVLQEVLDDRVALLLPPGDLQAWSGALKRLSEDPNQRNKLGTAARMKAEQFSWALRAEKSIRGIMETHD